MSSGMGGWQGDGSSTEAAMSSGMGGQQGNNNATEGLKPRGQRGRRYRGGGAGDSPALLTSSNQLANCSKLIMFTIVLS